MKYHLQKEIQGALLVIALVAGAVSGFAAPGDLDQTFGQGGRVFTTLAVPGFQYFYPWTESIVVQPDGKILVCGRFWEDGVSYWYGTYIVRYMPDGTLDISFGENGKVAVIDPVYPFGNKAVGADMALQPDGKIVLIGQYTVAEGIIVQRYTSSGMLDTTFGDNGTTLVTGIAGEEGTSITLQPDGKIVGVGWDYNPFVTPYYDAILIFRLNPNGSLDNSFGSAGTGVVMIDDGFDGAEVLVQQDSKILVVGQLLNFTDVPPTILLARYNANGSLDPSFGTGGMVTHRIDNMNSRPSASALQPDGKIVVLGTTSSTSESRSVIVRYNPNGSLDTSFASNGVFSVGFDFLQAPNAVLLQADGKIIAIGNSFDNAGHRGFAIVRLTSSGSLDPSFGVGGRSVFPINAGGTNYAYASNGAMQPDGKILLTGFFLNYYTDSHETIAMIRVDGGHSPRFDYDGDGKSDISTFRPSTGVWYLNRSTAGFVGLQWGASTDKIVPADYDGDGKTDIAVFRDGVWYWLNSSNGNFNAVQFGLTGDVLVPGDYTGDGRAELAVYRSGIWYTWNLANSQFNGVQFGISTDKPVPADFDGDGKIDFAVYRDGVWYVLGSTVGFTAVQFGIASDKPTIGDYDGDSKADQAVYRNGVWYVLGSTQGFSAIQFGLASDIPVAADYDGDGKTDIAVYRDGVWYLLRSQEGFTAVQFGEANDKPTPAAYVP